MRFKFLLILIALLNVDVAHQNDQCQPKSGTLYYLNEHSQICRTFLTGNSLKEELTDKSMVVKTFVYVEHKKYVESVIYFIEERQPHRILELNLTDLTVKTENVYESHKLAKELTYDFVSDRFYAIGHDDSIDFIDYNLLSLVTPPFKHWHRFSNLQLNPTKGLMFWIWLGYTNDVIMSGMDGQNIRKVYTTKFVNESIYSISLDANNNILYIAEETSILKMDLNTLEFEEFLHIKSKKIYYFNCNLFYVERFVSNSLKSYSNKEGHKFVGYVPSYGTKTHFYAHLPFYGVVANEQTNYINPCKNHICDGECILGEGPIATCYCPNCHEKSLIENEWFLVSLIFFCLMLAMLIVLFLELKYGWISIMLRRLGIKFNTTSNEHAVIFKNISYFDNE